MKKFDIGDRVKIKAVKNSPIYLIDNIWEDYTGQKPKTPTEYTLVINGVEQNFESKQLILAN